MFYSSSLRFLAKRSPPVTAASNTRPREALDFSVPVFGNSFAPAFLVDGFTTGVIAGSLVATFGALSSDILPSLLALAVPGSAVISG